MSKARIQKREAKKRRLKLRRKRKKKRGRKKAIEALNKNFDYKYVKQYNID